MFIFLIGERKDLKLKKKRDDDELGDGLSTYFKPLRLREKRRKLKKLK
jgi:hypothetical protein